MVGWGLIQQWVPDGRNNVLEDGRLSFHTGSGVSWNRLAPLRSRGFGRPWDPCIDGKIVVAHDGG